MQKIGSLNPGQAFGELALSKDIPRTASILCTKDSHFATLDKDSFIEILGGFNEVKIQKSIEVLRL